MEVTNRLTQTELKMIYENSNNKTKSSSPRENPSRKKVEGYIEKQIGALMLNLL